MEKYLSPSEKKLKSKGVESVRSRVTNLTDFRPYITYEMWIDAILDVFHDKHAEKDVYTKILTEEQVKGVDKIMQIYEELNQWEWRFGRTPDFSHNIEHKFDWALIDIHLDVKRGVIHSGQVFSDSLRPDFIDSFNEILKDPELKIAYDENGFKQL